MNQNQMTGLFLLVIIVMGGLFYYMWTSKPTVQQVTGPSGQQPGQTVVTTSPCGDDQLADVSVKFRNVESSAFPDYQAVPMFIIDTATNTALGSFMTPTSGLFASTSNRLVCGKTFAPYIVNNASYVAISGAPQLVDSPNEEFYLEGANATDVHFQVFSQTWVNETTPSGTWVQDVTTGTNNAMSAGSTLTMRLQVAARLPAAQFGAIDTLTETVTGITGRAFVCADFNLAKYNFDDVTLNLPIIVRALPSGQLPRICQILGYEKAWEITPIRTAGGIVEGTIVIRAGAGDPVDADNVRFIFVDNHYYMGSGGTIKVGTADDTGTTTGVTDRHITINIT